MEKKEILGVDQIYYYEKLDSGLEVFLFPYPNKKNYYVNYSTKYGSINVEFVPYNDKKSIKSNYGVAHFLEHKMFEQEDGIDPFTYFTKSGTGCNAGTSYKKTSYYIYGVNNLEENLNYLIDYVNSPYFTDENVEKEKGIIIEEIKMYDDNPEWILMEEMQKCTFKNHPIRYDIAGYVDTVKKITKDELYKCYNTFYHPSNMCLVVAGNIDQNKIMDIIKNNEKLKNQQNHLSIKQPLVNEPFLVNEKYKEIEFSNISVSKLGLTIKLLLDNEKDIFKYYLYINSMIKILFGSTSSFKEKILKEKYATSINTDILIVDNYLIIQFFIDSDKPMDLVTKIMDHFKNTNITEKELERVKKVQLASEVMISDNIDFTVENIVDDFIDFGGVINNKVDIIKTLNIKELEDIRANLTFDNNSVVVLRKKHQK